VLSEKAPESEMYNFEIDLDDELIKRNVICDEFVYGLDHEDDDIGELADFASEDVSLVVKKKKQ
jgi:hypothetical protein